MDKIRRHEHHEEWAHHGIIEAGDFVFIGYCVGDDKLDVEGQVDGAVTMLENRLKSVGLSLSAVVQIDALFADIWDIPAMETIFQRRFNGNYPVRKSLQTAFAHKGLLFQLDAIAYKAE